MDRALVPDGSLISLAVALGVGLLIGGERERRKRGADAPQAARPNLQRGRTDEYPESQGVRK